MKKLLFLPLSQRSIHSKLILFFLIVAIIPLILLSILSYYKSSKIVNDQFSHFGEYAVTQLEYQLDSNLSQMQIIARDLTDYLSRTKLIDSYINEPKTYEEFLEKESFERLLRNQLTTDIKGVFVITQSGYFFGENNLNVQKLTKEIWWNEVPPSYKGEYWGGFYEPNHYDGEPSVGERRVLGLIVPINHYDGFLEDSRILIEMDAEKLFNLFQMLEDDLRSNIKIIDKDDQVIYQTSSNFEPREDDIKWNKKLDSNNWEINIRIPKDEFYRSSTVIRSFTIIAIGFSIILVLILAYLFSSRITRKIKMLEKSMKKVSHGDLKVRTYIDSNDELGRLGESFNSMVMQIQTLINKVKNIEKQKKDAELRAIHYQINPHLLFNTLNSIQWKARLKGAHEISTMLTHLIMVLDGNLNIKQELISIERELKNIEHFFEIQKIRYGNVFSFHLNYDLKIKDFLIPRMTLQPLIENIFFHGFDDGKGKITLEIIEDEHHLFLTLTDNGKGISAEKLPQLLDSTLHRTTKQGLGVYNVDQKFRMHFGADFGLTIYSEKGEGTKITVCWPKEKGGLSDEFKNKSNNC